MAAVLGMTAAPPAARIATLAPVLAAVPEPVSFTALKESLIAETTADLAKTVLKADLTTFKEEVEKLAKKALAIATAAEGKKELADFIAKFVKDRGIDTGASKEPRDRWTIGEDPGLKPLVEVFEQGGHGKRRNPLDPQFGAFFFDPPYGRTATPAPLFQPQWYPNRSAPMNSSMRPDQNTFMTWNTEDLPARERTFDEAKALVVEAWKLQKARELAKAEADRLAKKAREFNGDFQKFKDMAAEAKADWFRLGPMAKLNKTPNPVGGTPQYTRFQIPADQVALPTPEFLEDLLAMRDKKIGETTVVYDMPKDHYYVAFLYSKDPVNQDDFQMVYKRSSPGQMASTMLQDPLMGMMEADRRDDFRKGLLDQLRADAKWTVNTELLKERDSREGGSPLYD
jgi:hypothetical protein